jgi:hypothetical protein
VVPPIQYETAIATMMAMATRMTVGITGPTPLRCLIVFAFVRVPTVDPFVTFFLFDKDVFSRSVYV